MEKKKNLIVEILVGIPSSGKSTWSKEFLAKNSNWSRVNRDSFRDMLRNEQMCDPKIEDIISKLMYNAIDVLLSRNLNVIVDNTHLKPKYINELIAHVEHRADISFKIFDISLEKAIERDKNRDKKVGENVIKKMHKDYINLVNSFLFENKSKKKFVFIDPPYNPDLPSIVIFDLDGTLAHMNGKRHPFDWDHVDVDDLDKTVSETFKNHMILGHRIFIVSGRDESAREKTEQWLDFYDLKYEKLLMRKAGDFRKDSLIKEEIYNNYIKDIYNVKVIYDDREQVVETWRKLGLKCFQVEKGNF